MSKEKEQLEALSEIRSMMERSSRFISLSGLSGVFSGIYALIGAIVAYTHLHGIAADNYYEYVGGGGNSTNEGFFDFLFLDAFLVLLASLGTGILLTIKNSKKKGIKIWDTTAKRLMINLLIPLATGGLFCLVLLYHGLIGLVAPASLIFYGLALINASKYTLNDIRYLGLCEIALGLIGSIYIGYGLLFWAFGFGILHIIYGTVMYFKYERK